VILDVDDTDDEEDDKSESEPDRIEPTSTYGKTAPLCYDDQLAQLIRTEQRSFRRLEKLIDHRLHINPKGRIVGDAYDGPAERVLPEPQPTPAESFEVDQRRFSLHGPDTRKDIFIAVYGRPSIPALVPANRNIRMPE